MPSSRCLCPHRWPCSRFSMVYLPREDSFLLEGAVRKYAHGAVLDMGTGSGIQAHAAMQNAASVTACDIDPEAVAAAKSSVPGATAFQSNLFSSVKGKFDTIVFNPPYLPDAEPRDIALDGGPTGGELLGRFLAQAKHYLTSGGQILFVQSSLTGIGKTKERLAGLGYRWEIVAERRIFFEELVVFRAWLQ